MFVLLMRYNIFVLHTDWFECSLSCTTVRNNEHSLFGIDLISVSSCVGQNLQMQEDNQYAIISRWKFSLHARLLIKRRLMH